MFTRPHLPITVKSAGNQGDVDRWPQLVGIKISKIKENVGLLIWNDAHEILQPKEVRESCHNGPYDESAICLTRELRKLLSQDKCSYFSAFRQNLEHP